MNLSEMREMSQLELKNKLKELQEKKFKLGFKHKTTVLKNPMEISTLRKNIARINTLIIENNNK
jgi:large subunit ribosomal protein L29